MTRKNNNPMWHVVDMDHYRYGPFNTKAEALEHIRYVHGDHRKRSHCKRGYLSGEFEYFPQKFREQERYQTFHLVNDPRLWDWPAALGQFQQASKDGTLPWR